MLNPYEEEFKARAREERFWVLDEGAGPRWEQARKKYALTASTMQALWNGCGYERFGNLLARLVEGKERVFSEYTKILMEEGRVHESEVEDLLLEGFVGAATWMRSPGIFEFELGGETIGASPDAILWLDRHHIPIEVKWHAKGECKYPMPCNYFAQLYTQMMATRATLGVYLGVAPSGEMCCTVLQRLAEVDDKFEEQVLWYRSERKMYERGVRKRYSEAIDKIDELRIKSIVFQKRSTADLLRFLRERTKQHDKDGTTDDFDPERNAVPPTRASTPACAPRSPHPLPLPRGHSNSPPLVGGRSRSASPRTRRVPTRELGESVVEGNAEVEGAS